MPKKPKLTPIRLFRLKWPALELSGRGKKCFYDAENWCALTFWPKLWRGDQNFLPRKNSTGLVHRGASTRNIFIGSFWFHCFDRSVQTAQRASKIGWIYDGSSPPLMLFRSCFRTNGNVQGIPTVDRVRIRCQSSWPSWRNIQNRWGELPFDIWRAS